jgi:hypothetical protein
VGERVRISWLTARSSRILSARSSQKVRGLGAGAVWSLLNPLVYLAVFARGEVLRDADPVYPLSGLLA